MPPNLAREGDERRQFCGRDRARPRQIDDDLAHDPRALYTRTRTIIEFRQFKYQSICFSNLFIQNGGLARAPGSPEGPHRIAAAFAAGNESL
jgi:hypothetical protein